MLCLAIHVYEGGNPKPAPSIRIPLAVVATIAKLVPHSVIAKLDAKGIELAQVVQEASTRLEPGVLIDVTNNDDRVLIAIEHLQAREPLRLTNSE